MSLHAREIRRLRGPKHPLDPRRAQGFLLEDERGVDGRCRPALTVFLTGAECPFTCVFCDLWRYTLDEPTPEGALPEQLRRVLEEVEDRLPARGGIAKLYNASNFFDQRAVPEADDPRLAEQLQRFEEVVVECHPKRVGPRAFRFAARLDPHLQVAMGLETVHPEASSRLGKGSTPADFARAAAALRRKDIGVRAFVLVGVPGVDQNEDRRWVGESIRFAVEAGAERVSLIPTRGGNGALEVLARRGNFQPPALADLERALDDGLEDAKDGAVVTADLWDLERFSDCDTCFFARRTRLERINQSGRAEPPIDCPDCLS